MNKMTLHPQELMEIGRDSLVEDIVRIPEELHGICYLASANCNGAKNKRVFQNVCSTGMRINCRHYQDENPVQNTMPDEITYSQLIISRGQA